MPSRSPSDSPGPDAAERAAQLCGVIERDYDRLHQGVIVLVLKDSAPLRGHEAEDRVQELLSDTVREALAHAHNYDVTRSGLAWLLGIAARLLLSRRRTAARARRQVAGSDLGEANWEAVLGKLREGPADGPASVRMDLQHALARLGASHRRVLELRYYQGLEREELAEALGVPSPGAARVRVCRALQALRAQFAHEDTGDKS